jgi:WD40 repeat protein
MKANTFQQIILIILIALWANLYHAEGESHPFTPLIISGQANHTIPDEMLYQLGVGTVEGAHLGDTVYLIAWGSAGTSVYSLDTLELILESPTELPVIINHFDGIQSFTWSPDKRLLALGLNNRAVYLWDVETHKPIMILSDDTHAGQTSFSWSPLVWSPTGETIAAQTSLTQPIVLVWNVATGEIIQHFSSHLLGVADINFSSDGRIIVTIGDLDNRIDGWLVETGEALFTLQAQEQLTRFWTASFSPDNHLLAVGSSEGDVLIQDIQTNETVMRLTDLPRDVQSIIWMPDGQHIIASSMPSPIGTTDLDTEDAVIIWALESGAIKHHFSGETMPILSPDGLTLITRDSALEVIETGETFMLVPSNEIIFRASQSGQPINRLLVPEGTFEAQWSYDGTLLATIAIDKILTLLE